MRVALFSVTIAVQQALVAQPVITSMDQPLQPYVHEVRQGITYGGYLQAGFITNGADVQWNFPITGFDSLRTVLFSDATASPCATDIMGANVLRQVFQEPLEHLLVNDQGVYSLGMCSALHGPRILATPIRQLQYPCMLGSSWRDSTTWTEPLTGRSGTLVRSDTVDGYGSVVIPWGSTGDLLGIRTIETWTTVQGADTLVRERWSRRLLKPGFRIPVLEMWMTPNYVPGDSVITWYHAGLRYLGSEQFLGVHSTHPVHQVWLSPQPVDDQIQLVGLDASGPLTTTIWDARGRRVAGSPWTGQPLQVSQLAPGIYVLEVDAPVLLRLPFVKR